MPVPQTDSGNPVPRITADDVPAMSDDECLVRLAQAIEAQDFEHLFDHLDEVAKLIGRLAVTIE
jgi:hypothetical protein